MFSRKQSSQAGSQQEQQALNYLASIAQSLQDMSQALSRMEPKVDQIHEAYRDLNQPR